MRSRLLRTLFLCAALSTLLVTGGDGVRAVSSGIVISQVYGAGGNVGAVLRNDFIELFNRGASSVSLAGMSVQYAASTGVNWSATALPAVTLAPGQYFLVQQSGGANGAVMPTPDATGTISMAAGAGKVALSATITQLTGSCPAGLVDLVGYGAAANCFEGGGPTGTISTTLAAIRGVHGCTETDSNNTDFATGSPAPRNTTTAAAPCGGGDTAPSVSSTTPATSATSVPTSSTIVINFNESVTASATAFSIECPSGSSRAFTQSASPASSFTLTWPSPLPAGTTCAVKVTANQVTDTDATDPPDTMLADYNFSFTTTSPADVAPFVISTTPSNNAVNVPVASPIVINFSESVTAGPVAFSILCAGVPQGFAPSGGPATSYMLTPAPYAPTVHLTLGNPTAASYDPSNFLMEKPEFTLSYNRDLGRPNWVSWHLSDEWVGTLTRVDTFRPDQQIPSTWYRVQSFDFSGSGFDRGHMTPNADRDKETSSPINEATFLMSNMIAQAPGNNQGPWAAFEGYLRTLVEQQNSELYIVSGPAGVGGTGSNGGNTNTLAGGNVTVPSSTWKVALVLTKDSGDDASRVNCSTRTIAVIMPNIDSIRTIPWQTYLTTVDAVEMLTGYDFFSTLPEPYQRCIEAGTDSNNPPLVKGDQTISFAQPIDRPYGEAPITVFATGGASGNAVTFSASGACTSSGPYGATITLAWVGPCTITASQAGSVIYNAADDVVRTFAIVGTTAPVIDAHADISAEATGVGGAAITYTSPATHDVVDGAGTAQCAPASGSTFPIGTTTVTCTATDAAGNAATPTTFPVTVGDTTAPVISYIGNLGAYGVMSTVSIQCSASDSGSGVVSTTCANITGPAYNFQVGVNTFSATATDASGSVGSASTGFTVSVTFADLQALGSLFSTNAGVANGLNAKLNAASNALNANARSGQLGAFQNQVNAQTGKALTAAQAAILLRLVQALY